MEGETKRAQCLYTNNIDILKVKYLAVIFQVEGPVSFKDFSNWDSVWIVIVFIHLYVFFWAESVEIINPHSGNQWEGKCAVIS